MNLLERKDFTSAAGLRLTWKLECDALTDEDWATLAYLAVRLAHSGAIPGTAAFQEVRGVPRGGLKLATAIDRLASWSGPGKRLWVDDVWTTGRSLLRCMDRSSDVGIVAFARQPITHPRVAAIFTLHRELGP